MVLGKGELCAGAARHPCVKIGQGAQTCGTCGDAVACKASFLCVCGLVAAVAAIALSSELARASGYGVCTCAWHGRTLCIHA